MLTDKELVSDYEDIMRQYEEDDEWDLPSALFVRWDEKEAKGAIVVIPSEDPKDFLEMMLDGEIEMAQAVFRGIGQVREDMPIGAIALINEAWSVHPETTSAADIALVERGEKKISELDSKIEVRLILIVTRSKGIYFGAQDRGGHFRWISRTDNPEGGTASGNLPYLLYPLVTGEPYVAVDGTTEEEQVHDFRTGKPTRK